MAVADLTRGFADAAELAASERELDVRLAIHDASRVEWSVALPLPERRAVAYTIDVEMEIPSHAFARQTPWDQLQSFTRLDGSESSGDVETIDGLRRSAVAVAGKLARASDGFARHCRLAASLFQPAPLGELEGLLMIWLDGAAAMVEEARAKLPEGVVDSAELRRERALVDEYISVRSIEMLAGAERALGVLSESHSAHLASYVPIIAAAEARIAEALGCEILHRAQAGYISPDPTSHETLERYLERASQLKKHFQGVLFLEPEIYQVAERIHHWVAGFVALLASTWAFAWQIALMHRAPSTSSQVGSGIVVVAVIAGLVYATKDRLKEVGRTWISGNVHRFYAQRVARFRAPVTRLRGRDVIVTAKESFNQVITSRPDPLNPESGAHVPLTLVHYVHRGQLMPQSELSRTGTKRVKHVFRYDFSPLFPRLDDAVKQVPVLDAASHRVKFTDAPRCYRFPIRVTVNCQGKSWVESAKVVMHKRGLDRLERAPEAPSSASSLETR
jgi:hypothetical protein